MNKEEYERLLKSDYWKGYSYSLIKERNFTCQDCGRSFYNERNKLQVHHLVYRDVNPWSYRPEEVIVLCEECHKKRHGIPTEPENSTFNSQKYWGEYNNNYSSTIDTKAKNVFSSKTPNYNRNPYHIEPEQPRGLNFKYIIFVILLFLFAMTGRYLLYKYSSESSNKSSDEQKTFVIENNQTTPLSPAEEKKSDLFRRTSSKKETRQIDNISTTPCVAKDVIPSNEESTRTGNTAQTELPKAEHIDEPSPKGADRELSTLEILERRNHADVVKQAKRAGVSTEGSTIDILERINHADVVKQAKRAGVSTEGSTIDILERINHADVVKQAKRAGVSTEGSTIDILERINRKEMEKYNY